MSLALLLVGSDLRPKTPCVPAHRCGRTQMPDTLPLVGGSHARVSYIFFNLIGYAAKFTHNGHISAKASQDNEGNVRVQVRGQALLPRAAAATLHACAGGVYLWPREFFVHVFQ
eukprot:365763-Chlamydomonas_euryale.AAC.24